MSKLKLLVVDDEPGIRSGIERILRNFNVSFPFVDEDFSFEILESETGEKAIEYLNSQQIDIILLDNKLPGMDGIEVLDYIKQKEIPTNVMMITSYASLELAIKATNNGAYNFVPKPFTPQELKTAIEGITKHLYLKQMTQKMKEQGKEIRFQFLSVLSHELKSPLNAVESYLKLIQEKQAGDMVDDYKVMIDRSLERIKGMRTLIMDLLDLTKIESGKKVRNIVKLDLHEIIKTTMDTISPMAIQKNIKIFFNANENLYFNADTSDMEIIFNNLVSNAVKYNRDNGTVNITVNTLNDAYQIIIEDTGIGMTQKEVDLLFGEFVRIKNEKTKNISGSGLGLSITKKMVESYKGTITVESTPDVGTKFIIRFPYTSKT